jgi:DNA-binding response OmpR family regulator
MLSREMSIVFCDPDLEWYRTLRAKLRALGVSVRATALARVLLEWTGSVKPDLVVLGEFPSEFGPEFLVGILRSRWPRLPVILVLSSSDPETADRLREQRDLLYVGVKPVSDDVLLASLAPIFKDLPATPPAPRADLVLCVDDDPQYLSSLTRMLRHRGYRVAAFDTPEQAMEELPTLRPDLAILDVAMAGMSGLQMAEEIREHHRRRIPIVMLSGLDSDMEIERGYRSGATSYLTKLSGPEAVLSVVGKLLGGPKLK